MTVKCPVLNGASVIFPARFRNITRQGGKNVGAEGWGREL